MYKYMYMCMYMYMYTYTPVAPDTDPIEQST